MSVSSDLSTDDNTSFIMDTSVIVKDYVRVAFSINLDLAGLKYIYMPLIVLTLSLSFLYMTVRYGRELVDLLKAVNSVNKQALSSSRKHKDAEGSRWKRSQRNGHWVKVRLHHCIAIYVNV